jgi:hypothetical protein
VGTTVGFHDKGVEASVPQTPPSNPVGVPVEAYEHLSHHPLRGHLFVVHSSRRRGGYCWGKLPQYHEAPITASGYGYD